MDAKTVKSALMGSPMLNELYNSIIRNRTSKHIYARKLRAAARLKKRRGIILDTPKNLRR